MSGLDVSGGSHDVSLSYAEARGLADRCDAAGDRLREWSGSTAGPLDAAVLIATAALAPRSCLRVERALAASAAQVAAAAGCVEVDARVIRSVVSAMSEVDESVARVFGNLHLHAQLLAAGADHLYPGHGAPVVTPASEQLGDDGGRSTPTPTSLGDLMQQLARVAGWSDTPDSPANGTIAIQTFVVDGLPHHVVYLPGTDVLDAPWQQGADVRDLGSAVQTQLGQPSPYALGVLEAFAQAGIRPGEPVLLAGHSQGGMVAWWLAHHPHGYAIGHVVTAGSPLGSGSAPAGVEVISLENAGDPVPWLDLTPNGHDPHHTTVGFDDPGQGVVGPHGLEHYVVGGAATDAATHPSLTDALASFHDAGFLTSGDTGTTQAFQIVRGP